MQFDVITLFPGMVEAPFQFSLMASAMSRGLFALNAHDLRDYAAGRHRVCDDYPFGGGEGMVMKVEPIFTALQKIVLSNAPTRVLLMSPGGSRFDQAKAHELTRFDQVVLLCGHYEGVDERVLNLVDEEVSIGDFVLTGGELAAMVVVETVARLLPGVVGCGDSIRNESFEDGLLDYPHYTRPRSFEGMEVPEVLLSGNHARIAAYNRKAALRRTLRKRPDLLARANLNRSDLEILEQIRREEDLSGKSDA
jgi:tRNA (guanine37-N1)-methyltransferase